MTILVALREKNGVHIASDKLSTRNGYLRTMVETKWVNLGPWWIGCAGNARLRTVLTTTVAVPQQFTPARPGALGVLDFIRKTLEYDGWKPEERPGDPPHYGVEGLITNGAELLSFGAAMAYCDSADFQCGGCGEDAARGAFHAAHFLGVEPHPKLLIEAMVTAAGCVHRDCDGFWYNFVPR